MFNDFEVLRKATAYLGQEIEAKKERRMGALKS